MSNKKFVLHNDLIYIIIASIALAIVIFIADLRTLRIILGLSFVLFFPGYVLIAALFVKKDDLDGIERVALSFGLSIAVVPLIGLALNYTPFGIRLIPILISLIVFIVIMSGVAFFRRKKLSKEECYYPSFEFNIPQLNVLSKMDKLLSVLLVIAILIAIGSIVYVISTPKAGEKFTEFYILGTGGKAEGYPRELGVNEKGFVILGIVNHEYSKEKYYVNTVINGNLKKKIGPVFLADGTKWEEKVDFSISQPKENVKVEFLLYRSGDKNPYRSLHLWVNSALSVSGEVNETPGEANESPREVNESPIEVNESPGEVNETPGEVNESPGGDNESPGGDNESPGGDNESPIEVSETPGEVSETPGEVSESPGEVSETPGEVNKL
ncbi:MAG: DUF1616 domain-containing protein [Eubacteriales bacterium]|jgi:uncharacterized membrane protein